MSLKSRKTGFILISAIAYTAVLIYEFLTPLMSDDLAYLDVVSTANKFTDLFAQEAFHYIDHTGRSVSHFIFRIFLYTGHKSIFNFVAAAAFVTLALLIYINVYDRKEYDLRLYGLILTLLWFCNPYIADVVFWEDGVCNYLYTTTIITGFATVYRLAIHEKIRLGKSAIVWLFLFGMAAGWCNENTSGGLILFVIIELLYAVKKSGQGKAYIKPWMISGMAGCFAGFIMLLASPANYARIELTEEDHTGIMAFLERFLKITNSLYNYYLILILSAVVVLVLLAYIIGDRNTYFARTRVIYLCVFVFFATSYALIMVPYGEIRSYFGASVFLMIGIANGVNELILRKENVFPAIVTSLVICAGIIFAFTYFEGGANLIRIRREIVERDEYFAEMEAEGADVVTAPMLSPEWETRFSLAHRVDVKEDSGDWINLIYRDHYNLGEVIGVPREDWVE